MNTDNSMSSNMSGGGSVNSGLPQNKTSFSSDEFAKQPGVDETSQMNMYNSDSTLHPNPGGTSGSSDPNCYYMSQSQQAGSCEQNQASYGTMPNTLTNAPSSKITQSESYPQRSSLPAGSMGNATGSIVGNPTTAASVVGTATTAGGLFGYDPSQVSAHYRQARDAAMYMNMVGIPTEYLRGMSQSQIDGMMRNAQYQSTAGGATNTMNSKQQVNYPAYDLAYYHAAAAAYDYMSPSAANASNYLQHNAAAVAASAAAYYRPTPSADNSSRDQQVSSQQHLANGNSQHIAPTSSQSLGAQVSGSQAMGSQQYPLMSSGHMMPSSYYYDYNPVHDRQAMLAAVAASYPRSYLTSNSSHYNLMTAAGMLNQGAAAGKSLARATLYPNTTTVSPVIQSSGTMTGTLTGKRPRGRPRKHPVAFPTHLPQNNSMAAVSYSDPHKLVSEGGDAHDDRAEEDFFFGCSSLLSGDDTTSAFNLTINSKYLQGFYSVAMSAQMKQLERQANLHHTEIVEDYIAFGAPFNRLGYNLNAYQDRSYQQELHQDDQSTLSSVFLENQPKATDVISSVDLLVNKYGNKDAPFIKSGIHLNSSFVWSIFNPKIPVRDLVISRHHMAVLLNNSRVLVYRHLVHPLVKSYVDRWDFIEELDHQNTVAIRIVSGCLPLNWRDRYHAQQQPKILDKVRQELKLQGRDYQALKGIQCGGSSLNNAEQYFRPKDLTKLKRDGTFSSSTDATSNVKNDPLFSNMNTGSAKAEDDAKTQTREPLTSEELEHLFLEHADGILCSPDYEPDWLPEPYILAAIDQYGLIRLVKCFGYHNYPSVVKIPFTANHNGTGPEQPEVNKTALPLEKESEMFYSKDNVDPANFHERMDDGTTLKNSEITAMPGSSPWIKNDHPTNWQKSENESEPFVNEERMATREKQPQYAIEYRHNNLNRVERQLDLTIPTSKVRVQVQDVALGEIIENSLYFDSQLSSPPEVAMVIYATIPGGHEHSVFIKGRNIYIRFKNFPAGPAKLYCGPLGHTGALLLTNGTVWCWSAQTKNSVQSKIGVSIRQVGGSLLNRHVIDLVALGAECLALTSDGIVHEWNNYQPYLKYNLKEPFPMNSVEMMIPYAATRPMIPEPIELTPAFQRKILAHVKTTLPLYKKGHFSWYFGQQDPSAMSTRASDTKSDCDDPITVLDELIEDMPETKSEAVEEPCADSADKSAEFTPASAPTFGQDEPSLSLAPSLANDPPRATVGSTDGAVAPSAAQGATSIRPLSSAANAHPDQSGLMGTPNCVPINPTGALANPAPADPAQIISPNTFNLPHMAAVPATSEGMYGTASSDAALYSKSGVTETLLEWERLKEIQRLYLSEPANLIERLYLTEGMTLFLHTAVGQFRYMKNSLSDYTASAEWSSAHRYSMLNNQGGFTAEHAKMLASLVHQKGKPLITNPVVVARMRLAPQHELSDNQLRQQLELMATTTTSYRILLSPTSIIVAFLRQIKIAEEMRKTLLTFVPVGIAAYHPSLTLQSFTGLNPFVLTQNKEQLKQFLYHLAEYIEEKKFSQPLRQQSQSQTQPLQTSQMTQVLPFRKHRGRVGRPKGSRSTLRSVLPHQRKSSSSYGKNQEDNDDDDEEYFVISSKSRKTLPTPYVNPYPVPSTSSTSQNDILWECVLQLLEKEDGQAQNSPEMVLA